MTMYAKVVNDQIGKFPYTLADLRTDNSGTSFPDPIPAATLASFDVYEVTETPAPTFDSRTHAVKMRAEKVNGTWMQAWTVNELPEQQAAANVRAQRNQLLGSCDWTQLADSPLDADGKAAWALYRESLRLVPQQAGFPWNVQWPSEPGAN